jgi:GntR family transcriptional regulator
MGLNPDDSRAAYIQIADDLRTAIRSGRLEPGAKLPSTTELMAKYEVANMTIQSALRELRGQDLIYSVQGKGTFVRSDVNDSGALDPDDDSTDYRALVTQLESMADKVDGIEQRLADLEKQQRPKSRRGS